jgi:hypothetical protein
MSLADAAVGANQAIQALLVRRELEKRQAMQDQLAQMAAERQNRQMDLQERQFGLQEAQFGETSAKNLAAEANTLGDQIPAGAILSPEDRGAQVMQQGGRGGLLTKNTTLPSTSFDTMGGALRTRSVPSDGQVQSLTKGASADQMDTSADNERAAAKDAWDQKDKEADNARADEQLRIQRMNAGGQGRETFDEWKRKEDYKNANSPKGGTDNAAENYSAERTIRTRQSVQELLKKVSGWTTGVGSVLANLPATDARSFSAELKTLGSSIAFNELTEMRAASKTGGALGNVSDTELALLTSALGALDQAQRPEDFRTQLLKIDASLDRWERAKAARQGGDVAAPAQPAAPAPVERWERVNGRLQKVGM